LQSQPPPRRCGGGEGELAAPIAHSVVTDAEGEATACRVGSVARGRAERPHGHIGQRACGTAAAMGSPRADNPPTALRGRRGGGPGFGSGGRVKAAGACSGGKAKAALTSVMMPSLTIPRRESASGPRGRACSISAASRRRLQPITPRMRGRRAGAGAAAMVIVGAVAAWRRAGAAYSRDEHGPLRQQVA